MRRLNAVRDSKEPLKLVKEFDAFPKIDDCYVETNARSGGVSLIMFLLIFTLVGSEVYYYTNSEMVYEYGVDSDTSSMLKINVDITIAMQCAAIGADLLDATGKHNIDHDNNLKEIKTAFALTREQEMHLSASRYASIFVRERYHSMHETIWNRGYTSEDSMFPERPAGDKTPADACRFKGSLHTRKLSGNFHITLGKPVQMFGGGHAHLSVMSGRNYNFSHRIHHLSFGDAAAGRVHPLDGDEHITSSSYHIYQYFVKVVPTMVNTRFSKVDTYQYSVTERDRMLDHNAGSHGTPGIFFKYDFSPIKVYVEQKYIPLWKFLIRLCGVVGGIFACTGILNSALDLLSDIICCRLKLGKYKPKDQTHTAMPASSLTVPTISANMTGNNTAVPTLATAAEGHPNTAQHSINGTG